MSEKKSANSELLHLVTSKPLHANVIDLTGKTFGRLRVIGYIGRQQWVCLCECSRYSRVYSQSLKKGCTQSCGCIAREVTGARYRRHGMKNTPEWNAWIAMRARCLNSNHAAWDRYGGRGITICKRWDLFENFYKDVGPRPSPQHSLDRYPDNNGNYEPKNIRWATKKEQDRNKRSNHLISFNGKMTPLVAVDEALGFKPGTIRDRFDYGWSLERALTTPVRRYERKAQCI